MSLYSTEQMLRDRYTLTNVEELVYDGRIPVSMGDEFFREWCKGKMMYRWNNRPEWCAVNERTGSETWLPLRWRESPVGRF